MAKRRRLAQQRKSMGYSQEKLAEVLNVERSTVVRWEAGDTEPQPWVRPRLAEALDLTGRELEEVLEDSVVTPVTPRDRSRLVNGRYSRFSPVSLHEPGGQLRDVTDSQAAWLHTRHMLNQHRCELTILATRLYPASARLDQTGILMPWAWRLEAPIDLQAIALDLAEVTLSPVVTGRHEETRPLRPLASSGKHYESYHRAMRDLDSPRLFENRVCYRLFGFEQAAGNGRLRLGHMRYFDMIDVGEAMAHELAGVAVDPHRVVKPEQADWQALPFRRLLRDPFELAAYPLLLSISTLTIRHSRAGATFLLLRRGMEQVAIAGGMLSVMPTGVFQPACILPDADRQDLNLWRNMMREYSEEFLGNSEHDGNGDSIDYAAQEPFRTLNHARDAGQIRTLCLGVGIDALNMVADVLTVAVFDADVFDDVFHDMVAVNEEGTVASAGRDREQFPFNKETIERLLAREPLAPSGAACLKLAWGWREEVLG